VTPIRATDEVVVPIPREKVWDLLSDIRGYSRWWPTSLGLRILSVGHDPVGAELEVNPARGRPFRCRVISVEPPSRMRIQYFGGFIEGTGEWRLEQAASGTRLTYSIDAQARGWLVALLSLVMNLGAVHSRQMREVFKNLSRILQEPLQSKQTHS
jgi:carbon monoxide dehydrogenase subunit G